MNDAGRRDTLRVPRTLHALAGNENRFSPRSERSIARGCQLRVRQGHLCLVSRSMRNSSCAPRCLGDGRELAGLVSRQHGSRLWAAAKLAFVYSALRFAEGYGLWQERTWAEWIAFGSGTLLLPLEVRELMRGITLVRSVVFAVNIAIVFYMFFLLRAGRRERRQQRLIEAETRDQHGN